MQSMVSSYSKRLESKKIEDPIPVPIQFHGEVMFS